jgi:hypothetical protein
MCPRALPGSPRAVFHSGRIWASAINTELFRAQIVAHVIDITSVFTKK